MPKVSISSDYAVLHAAGLRFYYGYERTTRDGMWCFSVEQENEVIFEMSHEALGANDMFEVAECLLLGIAQWMEHTKQALDSQET